MERPRGSLDTGSESRLRPGGGCGAGFPSGRQSRRATKGGAGKARGAGEGGSGEDRPGSLVLLRGEAVRARGACGGSGPDSGEGDRPGAWTQAALSPVVQAPVRLCASGADMAQAWVVRCGLMEKGREGSLSSWVNREAPGSSPPAEIPCRSPVSCELSAGKERQEAGNVCLQQLLGQGEG